MKLALCSSVCAFPFPLVSPAPAKRRPRIRFRAEFYYEKFPRLLMGQAREGNE